MPETNPSLLIIENDPLMARAAALILSDIGIETTITTNPRDGLSSAQERPYDYVLISEQGANGTKGHDIAPTLMNTGAKVIIADGVDGDSLAEKIDCTAVMDRVYTRTNIENTLNEISNAASHRVIHTSLDTWRRTKRIKHKGYAVA